LRNLFKDSVPKTEVLISEMVRRAAEMQRMLSARRFNQSEDEVYDESSFIYNMLGGVAVEKHGLFLGGRSVACAVGILREFYSDDDHVEVLDSLCVV